MGELSNNSLSDVQFRQESTFNSNTSGLVQDKSKIQEEIQLYNKANRKQLKCLSWYVTRMLTVIHDVQKT